MQPKEDRASHDALPGCRGDAGHKLSAPPFRGSMDAGDAEAGNPKRLHHTGESLARASDPACAAGAALKEHDEASAAEGLIALIAAKPLEPAIDRAQQEARGSCKAKPGVSPHESQAGCRNGDLGMPNESPGCAEKAERCGASGSRHPHAHAAQPAVCEFAPECPTHSGAARQGKEEQCAKPVGSIRADEPGPSDRDVAELEIRATQLTPQEQGSDGIGSAQQLRVRLMKALDRSFSDGVWSGADLKELCLAQAQVASILQMLSREISAKGFS